MEYFFKYAANSSIHGLRYIGNPQRHWSQRWVFSFFLFIFCLWLSNFSFLPFDHSLTTEFITQHLLVHCHCLIFDVLQLSNDENTSKMEPIPSGIKFCWEAIECICNPIAGRNCLPEDKFKFVSCGNCEKILTLRKCAATGRVKYLNMNNIWDTRFLTFQSAGNGCYIAVMYN